VIIVVPLVLPEPSQTVSTLERRVEALGPPGDAAGAGRGLGDAGDAAAGGECPACGAFVDAAESVNGADRKDQGFASPVMPRRVNHAPQATS
jgi:hypothetical protein